MSAALEFLESQIKLAQSEGDPEELNAALEASAFILELCESMLEVIKAVDNLEIDATALSHVTGHVRLQDSLDDLEVRINRECLVRVASRQQARATRRFVNQRDRREGDYERDIDKEGDDGLYPGWQE